MSRLNSIWLWIRDHKYFVVIFFIVLFVGVIDENSFLNRHYRQVHLDQLRTEIQSYKEQYAYADKMISEMERNPRFIEKIAREKYYMKRSDEDVFVVLSSESRSVEKDSVAEGGV